MQSQVYHSQLPPADAIIAIPQAEQTKVHGDKLLESEQKKVSSEEITGQYEKKTTETTEKFTFHKDIRSDEEKRQFGSMLDKTIESHKAKLQQTKVVRVAPGKRRDSWSFSESIGFGGEPNRIFDIYRLPTSKEEEIDPITSSIHCAALQARDQFKVARASGAILDMWNECKQFPDAFHPDMWQKSARTERLMQQQQQSFQQQQPLIQQGLLSGGTRAQIPIGIQSGGSSLSSAGSSVETSSGQTTRRVEISRIEERINYEEKKPIIAELQPGTLLQQRSLLGVQ